VSDLMDAPDLMDTRCTAKAKTTGNQCKRRPIPGGRVCKMHGGGAPQVVKKARERLDALVDPAIARLAVLVDDEDKKVALAAAKDILDRNDITGKTKHEATGADGGPLKIEVEFVGAEGGDGA